MFLVEEFDQLVNKPYRILYSKSNSKFSKSLEEHFQDQDLPLCQIPSENHSCLMSSTCKSLKLNNLSMTMGPVPIVSGVKVSINLVFQPLPDNLLPAKIVLRNRKNQFSEIVWNILLPSKRSREIFQFYPIMNTQWGTWFKLKNLKGVFFSFFNTSSVALNSH